MARPSEYKEEYIGRVDEYLALNEDFVSEDLKKLTVNLPTVEGFAMFLDVSKKTLYNWEDEHDQFLHALDKIREEQRKRLLNKGLSGDYNSTIAKLILSSNHGMREKSDVTTDGKELPQPLLYVPKNNSDIQNTED